MSPIILFIQGVGLPLFEITIMCKLLEENGFKINFKRIRKRRGEIFLNQSRLSDHAMGI